MEKIEERKIIDVIEIVDEDGDHVTNAHQYEGIDGYFFTKSYGDVFWIKDVNNLTWDEIDSQAIWQGK
jgi:hypothetical protein